MLCLFTLSNPTHHTDPVLALDKDMDVLSGMNPCLWALLLLAGGAVGIISWLDMFPFDVIKMQMQAHDIGISTGSGAREDTWWCAA
jgi:hypothetical protein